MSGTVEELDARARPGSPGGAPDEGPTAGTTADASAGTTAAASAGTARLAVLKALGDNTRYAIYLELARASSPRSTAQIAESLALHPNTVRPHLERMRDVGLLEVAADPRGGVGRPQHRYSVAADAPSLGLEPPAFPLLARMLVQAAATAGVAGTDAIQASREQGRAMAASRVPAGSLADGSGSAPAHAARSWACVRALVAALDDLGFDPASASNGRSTKVAFTHCPYRELAEAHPELVCNLHRGLIEGFVEQMGDVGVEQFGTLVDREPCQVTLSLG